MLHRFLSERFVYASVIASAVCVALLYARMEVSGRETYALLVWNLALAWIPFVASLAVRPRRLWLAIPAGAVWLLFLPNAPYLISDLVHLKQRSDAPLWFDVVLLFSFAGAGVVLGLASLSNVHDAVAERFGRVAGWTIVAASAPLTGLGIYLGRFLRWNSWDLWTNPRPLLADVIERISDPWSHPKTLNVTLVYALVFAASYVALRSARVPAASQRAE
jgi:uncharacterized membrane protein